MARRRRRFHGMVQIPGLGVLNKSVNTTDVLMGVALGFAGSAAVKAVSTKMLPGKVPDIVLKNTPVVGGLLAGAGAYFLESRKNMGRANAHLFGAAMAGITVQLWGYAKTSMPSYFGDVVSVRRNGYNGRYGMLMNSATPAMGPGAYAGLLVDDKARSSSNLNALADMAMGDSEGGIHDLMDAD